MGSSYPNHGRFVWRELMTNDVEAARRFYSAVFGWTWTEWDMGEYVYGGILVGEQGIGGIMAIPSGQQFPPNWTSYLGLADVDAAVAVARENGAQVLHGPQDIPNVGRFAVISDSVGAVFTAFRDAQPAALPERPSLHTFCWETLATPDAARSAAFYAAVAGWKTVAGPADDVSIFTTGEGVMVADLMRSDASWPAGWMTYVLVANVESTAQRVIDNGGRVLVPMVPVPSFGRLAVVADPQGAVFGVFEATQG